ncbi:MAG: N-acetylmuramoyl-L-alanine amidase [Nitrospinota bacterium]
MFFKTVKIFMIQFRALFAKHSLFLVFAGLLFFPFSTAAAADRGYERAKKEYHRLFENRPKSRGRWRKAAGRFFKIYKTSPRSSLAPNALFSAANLYGEIYLMANVKGDFDDALWLYNKFLNKFPQNRLADDSLFKAGQLLLRKGAVARAVAKFKRIKNNYRRGDMVSRAQAEIDKLERLRVSKKKNARKNSKELVSKTDDAGPPCVIVIDPGHGGKDVGAIGKNNLFEKDVTLDIGKRLKKKILKESQCGVVMTRDSDIFISLTKRTVIANKSGATLFISIHANANPKEYAHGVETYFLGHPKTQEARDIAARENMTDIKEEFSTKNEMLDFILADMSNNYRINESSRLAGAIQLNLVKGMKRKYSGIKNLGVKQALFYVLNGAKVPGILTEVSFITNPTEGKRLAKPRYREAIAASMLHGLDAYLLEKSKLSMNFKP